MIKLIQTILGAKPVRSSELSGRLRFNPEPPPGFVPRSDPNFYFLARKY